MRTTLIALIALAAACAPEELPDDSGELGLSLSGESTAPPVAYLTSVIDARTGKLLVERKLEIDKLLMPPVVRFVAALPSGRPLLVDVLGVDEHGATVASGAAIAVLEPRKKTELAVAVLARPGAAPGVLDATLGEAQLPLRHYLVAEPATNSAGKTQTLVARLSDAVTQKPVTDAMVLFLNGAVAPMFSPGADGAVVARFSWAAPALYPAAASALFAFLDGAGRGWVATVSASFESVVAPADIRIDWAGQVALSGIVMPVDSKAGRWLLAVSDPSGKEPRAVVAAVDADGDGDFDGPGELKVAPAAGRIVFFDTPAPTGIVMPVDIAGAILDSDGDGALDGILTIADDGTIATGSWPLDDGKK